MTLNTRNWVLLAGAGLVLLLFIGYSFILYKLIRTVWTGGLITSLSVIEARVQEIITVQPGFFTGGSFNLFRILILHFLLFLCSFSGSIFFRKYFRKITSPEIFFAAAFIVSVALDGVSILQVYRIIFDEPLYIGVISTRIVHFGHYFGIFCLFIASLFALGIQYQKFWTLLGIVVLLAAIISYLLPINQTIMYHNLLFKVDIETGLYFVYYAVALFTIGDYLFTAVSTGSKDKWVATLCILIFISSREVLFFFQLPELLYPGYLFLIFSAFLLGWRYRKSYMWE
jgi:hypothetical protein